MGLIQTEDDERQETAAVCVVKDKNQELENSTVYSILKKMKLTSGAYTL